MAVGGNRTSPNKVIMCQSCRVDLFVVLREDLNFAHKKIIAHFAILGNYYVQIEIFK